MKSNVATKPEESIAPPRAPKIDPALVQLDAAGQATRSWFVRLPEGAIADDLKEPSIWARVQQVTAKALRLHDRVYAVAFDESWGADAFVAAANGEAVTLAGIRIVQLVARDKALFRDPQYHVAWVGNGYVGVRNRDGHQMF